MSVVVALFCAVQAAFVVASLLDPRADGETGLVHLSLVPGWLLVVLAVSEVFRVRRDRAAELERAAHEEQQRRVGEPPRSTPPRSTPGWCWSS